MDFVPKKLSNQPKTHKMKVSRNKALVILLIVFTVLLFIIGGYFLFKSDATLIPEPKSSVGTDDKSTKSLFNELSKTPPKAPPFDITGKLTNIDDSDPKVHVWTLELNGTFTNFSLEQPVTGQIKNANSGSDIDYYDIKVGNWVFIKWLSYSPSAYKGYNYNFSAEVDSVDVAGSIEEIYAYLQSFESVPKSGQTKFWLANINSLVKPLGHEVFWITKHEDGTGRTIFYTDRIDFDGIKDRDVGCVELRDFYRCRGTVSDLSINNEGDLEITLEDTFAYEDPKSKKLFPLFVTNVKSPPLVEIDYVLDDEDGYVRLGVYSDSMLENEIKVGDVVSIYVKDKASSVIEKLVIKRLNE